MKTRLLIALGVAVLVAGAWLILRERPPEPPPSGKDGFGDPLPPWAVARIGRFTADPIKGPIVFAADGRTAAVRIGEDSVGRVEVATGRVLSRVRVHEPGPGTVRVDGGGLMSSLLPDREKTGWSPASDVAISPHGKLAAVAAWQSVRLIDLDTGEVVREFKTAAPWCVSFSADGGTLAFGVDLPPVGSRPRSGGEVVLVETGTGEEIGRFRHAQPLGIAFSPIDGKIAVNGWYFAVVSQSEFKESLRTVKFGMGRRAVAFSPDGSVFVRFEQGGTRADLNLVAHDAATGAERWRVTIHRYSSGIAFSPDGSLLATGGRSIRVFDARDGRMVREFAAGLTWISGVAFSPDGGQIGACRLGRLLTFDTATGQPANEPSPTFDPPAEGVTAAAWSPDSTLLAVGGKDGAVHLFDAATGSQLLVLRAPGPDEVKQLRFSGHGGCLAVLDASGRLVTLDVESGAESDAAETDPRSLLAWRGELRTVLSPEEGQGLRVTDPNSSGILPGSGASIQNAAISADGKLIVGPVAGPAMQIWDAKSRKPVRRLTKSTASRVSFSHDAGCVAVRAGGPLLILDTATGTTLFEIHPYGGSIVAVSPGGKLLAFGGRTPVIELWSGRREKRLTRLTGHGGWALGLAFSPDVRRLASWSTDGTLLVWDVAAWE